MDITAAVDAFAALGQDTRLQVFRLLLTAGPDGLPAGEVARRLAVPHNTMSTHLAVLARSGLLASRRESRQVLYTADTAAVHELVVFLVADCCGGRPDLCGELLKAALPSGARARASESLA